MKGVYSITNKTTGRVYIGSSVNIFARFKQHKDDLITGNHVNKNLQRDYNKFGMDIFIFKPIYEVSESIDRDSLYRIEQSYIDKTENLYNINMSAFPDKFISIEQHAKKKKKAKAKKDKSPIKAVKLQERFEEKRATYQRVGSRGNSLKFEAKVRKIKAEEEYNKKIAHKKERIAREAARKQEADDRIRAKLRS